MIILITGASHSGKTAFAQKLLEKYNYPYLSIDHLKMGLIRSGNTDLTPLSSDSKLTEYLWSTWKGKKIFFANDDCGDIFENWMKEDMVSSNMFYSF